MTEGGRPPEHQAGGYEGRPFTISEISKSPEKSTRNRELKAHAPTEREVSIDGRSKPAHGRTSTGHARAIERSPSMSTFA